MILKNKVPEGPLADKWTKYKSNIPLVSPANKRRLEVLVIGTGSVSYTHLRAHET